jgi:putative ABC transport system permease protein
MGSLRGNLRGGLRILVRSPAFALTVILVLGLGIGVNTLVLGVADAVFLRPLPYPNPSQLVWIGQGNPTTKTERALAPDFNVWRSQARSFSHVVAFYEGFRNFGGESEPEQVLAASASSGFLTLLGTQPAAGRDFLADEDRPGSNRVAILSHGFCVRRFATATACVGKTIKLNDEPFEVVGVLPDHFRFPEPLNVEVLTPLALGPEQANRAVSMSAGTRRVKVIARLRPGVTPEQAQAELNTIQQNIVQAGPQLLDGQAATLRPLREHLTEGISQSAMVLSGAVGFLWLLGCLNVGSLLFARTISRQAEMALRVSIGAGRLVLFKQVMAENAVLTFFGCLLSLFITSWGYSFVVSLFPQRVFGITDVRLDARLVALVIVSFVLTVLFVSLMAAWALPSHNVSDILRSGGAGVTGSRKLRRVLNVVVVAELAVAVVLLVGAGLMLKSFWALRYRDLGFRAEQILTLRLTLAPSRYPSKVQQAAFFAELTRRVAALPGVDAVALSSSAPPTPAGMQLRLTVYGQSSRQEASALVRVQGVNPDYFRALRIPLVDGEIFADRRQADAATDVVVNRALAREYLEDGAALGSKIRVGGSRSPLLTVVGVMEDFKNVGLSTGTEPEVYYPSGQFLSLESMYLLVKSSTAEPLSLAPLVRREVWGIDREQPLAELQTLDERLNASAAQPRFVMYLLMGFGVLALLLATAGIYGLMSYSSQQRTREIAIRMALGARREEIVWMILKEGLVLSLLGAAIGIACARASGRLLLSMLYGVAPSDTYTFITILVLIVITTVCACSLTAFRAAKVEPLDVLRHE